VEVGEYVNSKGAFEHVQARQHQQTEAEEQD
jgi:hypothetical protein